MSEHERSARRWGADLPPASKLGVWVAVGLLGSLAVAAAILLIWVTR